MSPLSAPLGSATSDSAQREPRFQHARGVQQGGAGVRVDADAVGEAVQLAVVAAMHHGNPGFGETAGVVLAFVAEEVEAARRDVRRRQAADVLVVTDGRPRVGVVGGVGRVRIVLCDT